ncbi:hypothetical protein GCM10009541_50600 [Micromonospora gifhornensis]|uniref:Uncharacterized protein n=2 Tax=Micromonospora gifhornensis TaxID=84594 RepID=A0ABQ4I7A5_9ACTN|nr:hypothetical protein Vgi01_04480 [Micromonospora gifhornensis]
MPGLLVHLVTLREQAAEQLADLHPEAYPRNLHQRFTDWVPVGLVLTTQGNNRPEESTDRRR